MHARGALPGTRPGRMPGSPPLQRQSRPTGPENGRFRAGGSPCACSAPVGPSSGDELAAHQHASTPGRFAYMHAICMPWAHRHVTCVICVHFARACLMLSKQPGIDTRRASNSVVARRVDPFSCSRCSAPSCAHKGARRARNAIHHHRAHTTHSVYHKQHAHPTAPPCAALILSEHRPAWCRNGRPGDPCAPVGAGTRV